MRICIVGAGAIGGLLAVRLTISGHAVSVIARGDHLTAIQRNGLELVEKDGSITSVSDLAAFDDFKAPGITDVVVLALKAHQILEVADQLTHLYGPQTVVLPVQNGIPWWYFQGHGGPYDGYRLKKLDPKGTLFEHIPAERILACIPYPAAEKIAPGRIKHVEGDRFPIGELDGRKSDRALTVAEALAESGFKSRVLTDIRSHIWIKAWGNLAFNPISALTNSTLRQICQTPSTRDLATAMMTEAAAVAAALEVHLKITIEKRITGAEAVGDHKTSMLQDVEAGQPLEIDPLLGVFVELGELVGVKTPIISAVYALASLLNNQITRTHSEGKR